MMAVKYPKHVIRNARDLRIGNIISIYKIDDTGSFYYFPSEQIIGLKYSDVIVDGDVCYSHLDCVGIPLTFESVIKLGFTLSKDTPPSLKCENVEFVYISESVQIYIFGQLFKTIIYLHELQNEYYDMCKKYLRINALNL